MKRLIAAVSIAVLAGPAFAVEIGKPFEQLDLDRALPDIVIRGERTQFAATAGETRTDATADAAGSTAAAGHSPFGPNATGPGTNSARATGPWADDWNFIAPTP